MTTCMYCGAQIADGTKFCTSCGAALPVEAPVEATAFPYDQVDAGAQLPYGQPYQAPSYQQPAQQGYQQPYSQAQPTYASPAPQANDSGSIGWGVLGFFFPIVGLVLFLVWRTTKPKCAKVAGIGAIVGFCLGLVMQFGMLSS